MPAYQYQAINYSTLAMLPGASVSIYYTSTTTLAPVEDINGNPITNPMTADDNGIVVFQVSASAIYDVVAQLGAYVSPRWLLSDIAPAALVASTLAGIENEIAAIMGGLTLLGAWNASTNSPALTSSVGTNGTYYVVSVAGSTTLNGNTGWLVGNYALFAGGVWNKIAIAATTFASVTVSSLAALAALLPSAATVYLTASGLAGLFNWVSGSFTTLITNDPGQGQYVAWSGDSSPGATGAWVRQFAAKANLAWWGMVSGAISDAPTIAANSAAWSHWNAWAQYRSFTLGLGVDMEVAPGTYPYDNALCPRFLGNIKALHITGYGATFQNVSTTNTLAWELACGGLFLNVDTTGSFSSTTGSTLNGAYFINQTTVGAAAFTTITPANAANVFAGNYVMLASDDIQYFGYPPNANKFEYVKILSTNQYAAASPTTITYNNANGLLTMTFSVAPFGATVAATLNGAAVPVSGMTATGGTAPNGTWPIVSTATSGTVVTLQCPSGLGTLVISGGTLGAVGAVIIDRPIRNTHLTTSPNGVASYANCGSARVWAMNNNGNGSSGANLWTWDVDHVYEGLTILGALHASGGVQVSYLSISGRSIKWLNSTINGISPTVSQRVVIENCKIPNYNEVDKLVDYLEIRNCDIVAPLGFQSSSVNTAVIIGGSLSGALIPGGAAGAALGTGAKMHVTVGVDIASLSIGPSQGANVSSIFLGCNIKQMPNPVDQFSAGKQSFTIDGTTITYANGVITMPWTDLSPVVEGMMLHLGAASPNTDNYTGDMGTGIVLGITGDATNLYIQTSFQYATIPVWASGAVFSKRHRDVVFSGCTGCGEVVRASEATKRGFQEWEWISDTFAGIRSLNGLWKPFGVPDTFTVKVPQTTTIASSTLKISGNLQSATNPATAVPFIWTIDLTTAGKRVIGQTSASLLLLGADTFTVSATTATSWPVGSFVNGNFMSWTFSNSMIGATLLQQPIVTTDFKFDLGLWGHTLTSTLAQDTINTMIALPGGVFPNSGGSLL